MLLSLFGTRNLFSSPVVQGKWFKIKGGKAASDGKKSVIYSRAVRDIVLAIRQGGSTDPNLNATLAVALKKARVAGLPKDNIETAISRAANPKENPSGQEFVYGAMTAYKIGLQIDCFSDNPTRSHHNIRAILKDHGACFATTSYLFQRKGVIRLTSKTSAACFENLWDLAVDAGAEEVEQDEDGLVQIVTPPERLISITNTLASSDSYDLSESELAFLPSEPTLVPEGDGEEVPEVMDLKAVVSALEDDPDCVRVWTTLA